MSRVTGTLVRQPSESWTGGLAEKRLFPAQSAAAPRFNPTRAVSFQEEDSDGAARGPSATRQDARLGFRGPSLRPLPGLGLFWGPSAWGPPRRLEEPTVDGHAPEGPAVWRRPVVDDGEDGGQHAQEEHEQEHGQVEVVGPAGAPGPG